MEEEIKEEKKVTQKKSDSKYVASVGRRKEAIARIRLHKGRGESLVNNKPMESYFTSSLAKIAWKKPFEVTKSEGDYFVTIKVAGSGKKAQVGAIIHGISRALSQASTDFRPLLKKAGLLTRDPRVKERRKYGLAQKARKGKQSPKR